MCTCDNQKTVYCCMNCNRRDPLPSETKVDKIVPKVGETWLSSTGVKHLIVAVSAVEIVTFGGLHYSQYWVWDRHDDSRIAVSRVNSVTLVKEFKTPRTVTVYWWSTPNSNYTWTTEQTYSYPKGMYEGYKLLGKTTITEGEGLDGVSK